MKSFPEIADFNIADMNLHAHLRYIIASSISRVQKGSRHAIKHWLLGRCPLKAWNIMVYFISTSLIFLSNRDYRFLIGNARFYEISRKHTFETEEEPGAEEKDLVKTRELVAVVSTRA